jgi:hypothetical protein
MPFAVAGAAIGAAGAIGGGIMQSQAAAAGQKQAQRQFEQQRADMQPYREAGLPSLDATQSLLGLQGPDAAAAAMANFTQSPGYQFQLDQGLRAVDAGAAEQGLLRSGATLKAEQAFGSGLAASEFGNYYNRLFELSKLGESAAAGGVYNSNAAASTAIGGANAQSSIYGNTASSLGNIANSLLSNKDFQGWLSGSGGGSSVYSSTPNLIWNPNNPVGTSTLGGGTANQGWFGNNFG